ncbi:carbohydrate ABC transporter permease [Actinomadura sp. BRA 177]|uniref:carbohydrate ABC transporter permease n=1 Tax=Actinomadura sp. BRA 177 TaxID=2745202 RepID=UPI001595E784|nr:sugar ABC transporter permease [Actinomadura sp. BRA 177]NVI91610.1 sugar ABC transporter permease [Actinomadura sp. BRA 177]
MTVGTAPPRLARTTHAAGRKGTTRRRLMPHLVGWGFVGPATLVVVGLSLFPAVWALWLSLHDSDLISSGEFVGLANYREMVHDPALRDAAWHTAVYTVLYVPGSVLIGLPLAVALNQRIRGIGFYRTCIFVPYVTSAAAVGILSNFVLDPEFGVVNSGVKLLGLSNAGFLQDPDQALYTLVAISLWWSVGLPVVVYLAALQDVPRELQEAALVDGANPWQAFRNVTLPQLRPATTFVVIWQMITALQLFDLVYTTTKGQPLDSTSVLVYYLYEQAFKQFNAGYGAAVAYALFVVTLVVSAVMLRRSAGTAAGARS